MKKTMLLSASVLLFVGFYGCSVEDVEKKYDQVSSKYEEVHGGDPDRERPFDVVFQPDPNNKQVLISAGCGANANVASVYYQTPADASSVLHDTYSFVSYPGNEKPYWDFRYVNPSSRYVNNSDGSGYANHGLYTGLDARTGYRNMIVGTEISKSDPSGSVVESECVDGVLTAGTNVNLNDAPIQNIAYGGPQSTFTYKLGKTSLASPWKADGSGNLVLQASFDKPLYIKTGDNDGGSVSFLVFIKNKRTGTVINYVIGAYAAGVAWTKEKLKIQYDTTTDFVHVGSVASENSWWTTKSPASQSITEVKASNATTTDDGMWPNLFRVNIGYDNLKALLDELKMYPPEAAVGRDFGQDPSEWYIMSIAIQYELAEVGGTALLSGSFRGFEAYITQLPI